MKVSKVLNALILQYINININESIESTFNLNDSTQQSIDERIQRFDHNRQLFELTIGLYHQF